ncbi:GNAT family N-acetyltransferase [Streptomyces sp. NBC_00503]|uniref:GNAT family N-acetyltransferase n=1 Tax=Streptomyces sp. NBC_00503 TaxID=2903659 RepID=UPI002E80D1FE|nr:GNAT family N-acetyltransferase [Streptomyces sp. NBC_00503]WUD81827.1 GNAT family N-acetyltransferase [Streptomyces sp. NBC_00503]
MSTTCCSATTEEPVPALVVLEEPATGCCSATEAPEAAKQEESSCCGTTEEAAPAKAEEPSGCCGPAAEPEPAQATGCCGPAKPEPVSCCGSAEQEVPADVRTGLSLHDAVAVLGGSVPQVTDPAPYVLPHWLEATEASLEGAKPWYTVADRGEGELAFLPGFLFDADPIVDADPRTYLGWQPKNGAVACCSATSCCDTTNDTVEALGTELFFPTLLLGSPLGYRSEASASVEDPLLVADLIDRIVPAAAEAGVRSIVAPWLHDSPYSEVLALALQAYGGDIAFHGENNLLDLQHDSYDAYLASLPARKRRRVKEDRDRAANSGTRIERKDRDELRPLVGRISELITQNRQKYGGGEDEAHIGALLSALVEGGADVRAYLAYKDDEVAAVSVTVLQGKRLFVKWAGFDYEALGERSGIYFEIVLDRPLRDAYAEGVTSIEAGPGADEAKRLRGFKPRQIRSAILVTDTELRPEVAKLHAAFGQARRDALGATTAEAPTTAIGRLKAKLLGGSAYAPIEPLQPEGGCCG